MAAIQASWIFYEALGLRVIDIARESCRARLRLHPPASRHSGASGTVCQPVATTRLSLGAWQLAGPGCQLLCER